MSTPHSHPNLPGRRQSSSSRDLQDVDVPRPPGALAPLVKHGKYVVPGALGVWATGVADVARDVLDGEGGWIRKTLLAAIGFYVATVLIFLYLVVFLPWLRGYMPNYPRWQQSARLRVLVPVLTATILLGWTSLVVALSQAGKATPALALRDALRAIGDASLEAVRGARGLGLLKSMAGATAFYSLTFGALGLIPTPTVPVRIKEQ
ncbi:hypothetical protein Q5752_001780 [Cryptotrichosporon argae]